MPYYSRLEQGTSKNPSRQVTLALSRALALDDADSAHLLRLAGHDPKPVTVPELPHAAREHVHALMATLRAVPAAIIGPYFDVMDATALMVEIDPGFTPGCNLLEYIFFEPSARKRLIDWRHVAMRAVSMLRARTSDPDDARIHEVIEDLARRSTSFQILWQSDNVAPMMWGRSRIWHPRLGPLHLSYTSSMMLGLPGQILTILSADAGSADDAALTTLRRTVVNEWLR